MDRPVVSLQILSSCFSRSDFLQSLERNSTIPVKKTKNYTTVEDNQVAISFPVFEGERPMTIDNRLLGKFVLRGIPPQPRGKASVDVTFDIDANGILNVTAFDNDGGRQEKIIITNDKGRLTDDDISKLIKEADRYASEDQHKKVRVEAKNKLE